jgi:hypothetical protein
MLGRAMQILLTRLTDDQHRLEIVRADGSSEALTLETRSCLLHDLLHLAVESEAGFESGFWGCLARGKTLADMNDRTGEAMKEHAADMATIEQAVGALTGAAKGVEAAVVMEGLHRWLEAQERQPPPWLDVAFIIRVQERMRRLMGHWRATRHGQTMAVTWPDR